VCVLCRAQGQKQTKTRARRSLVLSTSSPQPKRRRQHTFMSDAESDADAARTSQPLDNAAVGTATTKGRQLRALKAKTDMANSGDGGSLTPGVSRISGVTPSTSSETVKVTSDDDELPAFDKVSSSFTVGDLIWVKFRQYPFWPALVSLHWFFH